MEADTEVPETVESIAMNGHLMVYRVIRPTFPGGVTRLSQHDAQCAARCPMCRAGEPRPGF